MLVCAWNFRVRGREIGSGEIEYRPIVCACESCIHPTCELLRSLQTGNTFVFDGGEHGPADENLSTRVSFSLSDGGSFREARAFGAQSCEPIVDGLDSDLAW